MIIKVSTVTDDYEEIEASFNVYPLEPGDAETEFVEAYLETHTGRKISVTEAQLETYGVLQELRDDAISRFDRHAHDEENAEQRADEIFQLERSGLLD